MPDRILGLAGTYKFFGMFTDKKILSLDQNNKRNYTHSFGLEA